MSPTLLALALCLSTAAQEPAPEPAPVEAEAPVAQGPEVDLSAQVLPEYLQGQKILVTFVAENQSTTGSREFPDLSNRPWLVKFDLVLQGEGKQKRYTTPPAKDPGKVWTLPKGTERRVLLEIPSSAGFPLGKHKLTIEVDGAGEARTLGPYDISVVRPKPQASSGPWDSALAEKVGQLVAWTHSASESTELYLLHLDPTAPGTVVANYHLASLEQPTTPWLSRSLPAQGWSRHVYWQESDRRVGIVQLQGPGRSEQFAVDAPWPEIRILGTGVSDAGGGLHVPVWVPGPKGDRGEVRVLTWRRRQVPWFRKVVRLDAPPAMVATGVDASGSLRLLLHHDGHADLYTVITSDLNQLPARGDRLEQAEGQGNIRASTFGVLPPTGEWNGGRALMLLEEVTGEKGERRIRARWLSLSGRQLHTGPSHPWDAAWKVHSVVPQGADGFAAILEGEGGTYKVISAGGKPTPVQGDTAPELAVDGEGTVWLRTLVGQRALVKAKPVSSPE